MATLQGKLISSTYPSLLHTSDPTGLTDTDVSQIQDGSGVDTALSLGSPSQGAAINGNFRVLGTDHRSIGTNSNLVGGRTVTLSAASSTGAIVLSSQNNRILGATLISGNTTINGSTTINGTTNVNATLSADNLATSGEAFVADLRIGAMRYPNTIVDTTNKSVSGKFLQVAANGTQIVYSNIGAADVTSNNPRTITRTTYFTNTGAARGKFADFTLGPNGTTHTVPLDPDTWAGAKGGIFFLQQATERDDSEYMWLITVSPTTDVNSAIWGEYVVMSGRGDTSGDMNYRTGGQFQCPIDGNDPKLVFRNIGMDNAFAPNSIFNLYYIAIQF